jgi:hypothetical protein
MSDYKTHRPYPHSHRYGYGDTAVKHDDHVDYLLVGDQQAIKIVDELGSGSQSA